MNFRTYVVSVKWFIAMAVFAVAMAAYLSTRTPESTQSQPPAEEVGSGGIDGASTPRPMLAAGAADTAPSAAEEGHLPDQEGLGKTAPARSGDETPASGGEVPVVSVPKLPTKEEHEAAVKKARAILEGTRPVRATWNDAPLHDVLVQLSERSGLVLALGPGALRRAENIRVSDPLRDAASDVDPNVWNILEALAKEHRLVLHPWEKGVLLRVTPDPAKVRLRYYDMKELLRNDWGSGPGVPTDDRLDSVLPELVRESAELERNSAVRLRNGIMIARQTTAAHERIAKLFAVWRKDPKNFQQVYRVLISKRHPTVSGAPQRTGSQDAKGERSGK